MRVSPLIAKGVRILVSDPWELGTECGVGPFAAVIVEVERDALLLRLQVPIEYRGAHLQTVVARARHAPATIVPLTSEGRLAAKRTFLRGRVTNLSQVTGGAKTGMVPAIGRLQSTTG